MRERTSYRVPLLGTGLIGLSLLAVLPGWSGGQESSAPRLDDSSADSGPRAVAGPDDVLALPGVAGPGVAGSEVALPEVAAEVDRTVGPDLADKEHRIRQLEAQLNHLQAAVQALRAGDQPATGASPFADMPKPAMSGAKYPDMPKQAESPKTETQRVWANGQTRAVGQPYHHHPQSDSGYVQRNHQQSDAEYNAGYIAQNNNMGAPPYNTPSQRRPGYHIETLTRARYRLPEATANALASLIREHVKGDVEARVTGDTLTVIASQEDQAKIGAFVDLLGDEETPDLPGGRRAGNKGQQPTPGTAPGADVVPLSPARR